MPPRDAWPLAAAAARRALELDHTLGEAHTSLAHVHLHYRLDLSAAEGEFRRAVELHPAYSTAHHWLSHLAMAMGRPETSLAESRRCLELDPTDLIINVHLIWHYWLARQPDEAIEQGSKTRELYPNSFWSEFFIGLVYEDKQMPDAASPIWPRPRRCRAGVPSCSLHWDTPMRRQAIGGPSERLKPSMDSAENATSRPMTER